MARNSCDLYPYFLKLIKFSDLGFEKVRKRIETGDIEFPIEIYNVDNEQRPKILELIKDSLEIDEEKNSVSAKISDSDFIYKLLGELSNIYLDLDDKETINNILTNPSPLLRRVKREISEIMDEILLEYYEELKSLGKLLEDIQKEFFKLAEENVGKQLTEKEKKRLELERQLAELEKDE